MAEVTVDIRGIARPQASAYDIGSFEGAEGVPLGDPSIIPPSEPSTPIPYSPPLSSPIVSRPSAAIPTVACTVVTMRNSPASNAGSNTGGIGWEPSYTGLSGSAPMGAAPVDGETLTGKEAVNVWANLTHYIYF